MNKLWILFILFRYWAIGWSFNRTQLEWEIHRLLQNYCINHRIDFWFVVIVAVVVVVVHSFFNFSNVSIFNCCCNVSDDYHFNEVFSLSFFSAFLQITEDVSKKRCEYQKHLEYYKLLRSKFEEHYIKGKNWISVASINTASTASTESTDESQMKEKIIICKMLVWKRIYLDDSLFLCIFADP